VKEKLIESRNDFRGGLNVYLSPDLLSPNELIETQNARIDTDGPVIKRTGSRRLHASALNAATEIKGSFQWDGPSGSQLVAICNGDLFYRNLSSGEFAAFTQVDPGATDAFSTTSPALFATLRGSESGAPLRLYISSGGKLYEWTGTTLSRLDGVTSSTGHFAPDASLIATYHLRLFTNSILRPQHLVWSRIGNGRVFKGGLGSDGGTAMVSAIQADDIVNLQTLGRSLLIFTNNSISRLAGYSAADIQIEQDTEGVSPDVGCVGATAAIRAEHLIFFVADRGCYLASEGAIAPVGLKIQPLFDAMDRTRLTKIVVGLHRGRNEIWVAYTGSGDSSLNKSVLVYNLRHQAWYGPFTYTFGISSFTSYEDLNGDEYLIAGCSDGFMRHMDTGTLDDVTSAGSGGTSYDWTVEFAPFTFNDPSQAYALRKAYMQMIVPDIQTFIQERSQWDTAFSGGINALAGGYSTSTLLKTYGVDLSSSGPRPRIRVIDNQSTIFPEIHGIMLEASAMIRRF
jgi:hypothetical protein